MKRMLILMLAAALAVPSLVFAHEGHPHKVLGTVTAIQKNTVEVKDKDGKITKHVIEAKTKIRKGKSNASLTEIKVGDRIVVTFLETKDKATGKVVATVTQVDLGVTPTAAGK
jgi:hypothetical protein